MSKEKLRRFTSGQEKNYPYKRGRGHHGMQCLNLAQLIRQERRMIEHLIVIKLL